MPDEKDNVTVGDNPEANVTVGDPSAGTPAEPFRTFTSKEELDKFLEIQTGRAVKAVKTTEREAAEKKAKEERQKREEALKEQEDWKTLAAEHAETIESKNTRISELEATETAVEAANDRVQTLEARLKGLITPQLEAVPELYRPFVRDMPVERQAEWLEANADKLGTQAGPGRPAGSRPTGRPETPPRKEQDKEARENQRRARVSAI